MSTEHKALGRGIGALIPSAMTRTTPAPRDSDAPPARLPLELLVPNPDQPRRVFDSEEIEKLANSVRRHGVLQPVVVRRAGSGYELVCGERRWRAATAAGLQTIPAVVVDAGTTDRLELALVENIQRNDLNPIELAHAFQALGVAGATQEEIGRRVGLDRSTIANHLRLLELPREFQTDVEMGRFSIGHAKALLQIENPEQRRHLRNRIVKEGLPVRATEGLARAVSTRKARRVAPRPSADPNRQRLVDSLRVRLQTRVRIQGEDARGRIEIEYFGTEDLGRIVGLLLGEA